MQLTEDIKGKKQCGEFESFIPEDKPFQWPSSDLWPHLHNSFQENMKSTISCEFIVAVEIFLFLQFLVAHSQSQIGFGNLSKK